MRKIRMTPLVILMLIVLSVTLIVNARAVHGCTKSDFDNAIGTTGQTIYINPDGSVTPQPAPIQQDEDKYAFTDNVYNPIVINKDDVTIDGAGYTLQGPYNGTQTDLWIIGIGSNESSSNETKIPWSVGIDFPNASGNLTIRNLNIQNFSIGLYLWTPNNIIIGNSITQNLVGILLSGSNNSLTKNYIANNQYGIFFGANEADTIPSNITLVDNGFVNNSRNLSGCVCEDFNSTEATHTWDNGKVGNYWSDYNGSDNNKDGIGDNPYIIDVLNQDRFPLTHNSAVPPSVPIQIPLEIVVPIAALSIILVAAYIRNKKKPTQIT
jgi:parallel beta-helix repeat protein